MQLTSEKFSVRAFEISFKHGIPGTVRINRLARQRAEY